MLLNSFSKEILSFIESSSVFTVICDSDGKILYANAYAKNLIKSDFIGCLFQDLLVDFANIFVFVDAVKDGTEKYMLNIDVGNGVDSPETLYFKFFEQGSNILVVGEHDYYELKMLRDSMLTTNSLISTLNRDIEKKKHEYNQLNEKLKQANTKLEKLNKTKNEFMGMAAHDLKSPLNGIFLACETIKMEDYEQNLVRDIIGLVSEQTIFMINLINSLLDVSSIEAETFKLNLVHDFVDDVVEECVKSHRIFAEKRGLTFIRNYKAGFKINFDPAKLRQVLDNLFSNAIKYSNENTNVCVDVESDNNHLIIKVKDEGPGIPEIYLKEVFKPFSKIKEIENKTGLMSSGLGLSISKKLIEAHGGNISLETAEGQGCLFIICLPVGECLND